MPKFSRQQMNYKSQNVMLTPATQESLIFITVNLFINKLNHLLKLLESLKSANISRSFNRTFALAAILVFWKAGELLLNAK